MKTKVIAAFDAATNGIKSYIANADLPVEDVLSRKTGTYFPAP